MRQIIAALIPLMFLTGPAHAQAAGEGEALAEREDGESELSRGLGLLQDGASVMLEGLMEEIGPALEELRGRAIDLTRYEAPEMLPNGDIIIRRKPDAPELDLEDPPAPGEVDI